MWTRKECFFHWRICTSFDKYFMQLSWGFPSTEGNFVRQCILLIQFCRCRVSSMSWHSRVACSFASTIEWKNNNLFLWGVEKIFLEKRKQFFIKMVDSRADPHIFTWKFSFKVRISPTFLNFFPWQKSSQHPSNTNYLEDLPRCGRRSSSPNESRKFSTETR